MDNIFNQNVIPICNKKIPSCKCNVNYKIMSICSYGNKCRYACDSQHNTFFHHPDGHISCIFGSNCYNASNPSKWIIHESNTFGYGISTNIPVAIPNSNISQLSTQMGSINTSNITPILPQKVCPDTPNTKKIKNLYKEHITHNELCNSLKQTTNNLEAAQTAINNCLYNQKILPEITSYLKELETLNAKFRNILETYSIPVNSFNFTNTNRDNQ